MFSYIIYSSILYNIYKVFHLLLKNAYFFSQFLDLFHLNLLFIYLCVCVCAIFIAFSFVSPFKSFYMFLSIVFSFLFLYINLEYDFCVFSPTLSSLPTIFLIKFPFIFIYFLFSCLNNSNQFFKRKYSSYPLHLVTLFGLV